MANSSFVLRALSILGLEEILKLSEILHDQQVPLKKAAGEELIIWADTPTKKKAKPQQQESNAKVLDFPKKSLVSDFEEIEDPNKPPPPEDEEQSKPNIFHSDLVMWQREIAKESGGAIKKVDAVKGYQKSTQMYVVKSEGAEGKTKIRFASTDGILVNKKQS